MQIPETELPAKLVSELRFRVGGWSASSHLIRGQSQVGGGQRGVIVGWSSNAARRNQQFLQSVDYSAMPSGGHAVTLTVRALPSPLEWQRTRRRLLWWLAKRGASVHWVTEWQRRGVPHLHLAVWGVEGREVVAWWLEHTDSGASGQHTRRIRTPAIWAQYCAKHGQRGVNHYQRNKATLVGDWRTQSAGKLWGRIGKVWAMAAQGEEVWQIVDGEAGYRRLAERMRGAIGGGAFDFMRGCGAWGACAHLVGIWLRRSATDPPIEGHLVALEHGERYLQQVRVTYA